MSGFAAADALAERGAPSSRSSTAGARRQHSANDERANILDILGVTVRQGEEHTAGMPAEDVDLVVTSPGWRPDQPMLLEAAARGIPVWGEVELAWRMRAEDGAAPWLTVTGTNGKTTTVNMLASILRAAGLRATSAGNVGTPILEAVLHPQPFDVIAVELSSFQLHWQVARRRSRRPASTSRPTTSTGTARSRSTRPPRAGSTQHPRACVYNVRPATEQLVRDAEVRRGAGRSGSRWGCPASMVGVVDDILADRASSRSARPRRPSSPPCDDVRGDAATLAPHNLANALAAAALARAYGVPPSRSATACAAFRPEPHRIPLRRGRRRALRRRLQGHQPPRGTGVAAVLRARRLGRRRAAQGCGIVGRPRPRGRAPGCAPATQTTCSKDRSGGGARGGSWPWSHRRRHAVHSPSRRGGAAGRKLRSPARTATGGTP